MITGIITQRELVGFMLSESAMGLTNPPNPNNPPPIDIPKEISENF